MDEGYEERLRIKIAPESVGQALIQAGALLTGYELIKSKILDGVRSHFTFGFTPAGWTIDPEYESKVLALVPGNRFQASVAWLVEMEAFEPHHAEVLERIRTHRGEVAHELARLLVDPDAGIDVEVLRELRNCMRALDRFFGGMEVDMDPEFDRSEVDYDSIRSGSGLLLDYLMDLCGLGDPGDRAIGPVPGSLR